MAKATPKEILEDIKSVKKDAKSTNTSIKNYAKTAKNKSNTIEKLLTSTTTKVTDTLKNIKDKFTKESDDFRDSAKKEKDLVESIRKQTKDQYNRFNQTYTAATGKKSGVEAKHTRISELLDDASSKAGEISKNYNAAEKSLERIKKLQEKSNLSGKNIEEIASLAEGIKIEIENTYGITLDTAMSGTFLERRNTLKSSTRLWQFIYLSSIVVVVISAFTLLAFKGNEGFREVVTERLIFVTPFVLLSYVLSKQFSHERKLYEEYAFKSATAQSLRGYTVLLNDEFNDVADAKKQILNFTIETMKKIYDREVIVQAPSLMYLAFGNKWAKAEAKLEENKLRIMDSTNIKGIKETTSSEVQVEKAD